MRLSAFLHLILILLASCPAWAVDLPNQNTRLGLNVSGIADWSAELPFVDIFKSSAVWVSQQDGQPWGQGPALDLDANGWVQSLQPNSRAEVFLLTGMDGHCPTGNYVILYDGQGTLVAGGLASITSSSPGRMVAQVNGQFYLSINSTNPSDYLRNIRVIMPGHESTYQTQPFNPDFLNMMKSYNTIRFVNWMEANNSPVSTWSQRPTLSRPSWTAIGAPLEIMIDLCNRTKSNPWFCIPHLATDDYITRFATMVRERLDPSLRAYVEYSNEVWNFGFNQTHWAMGQGRAAGLSNNDVEALMYFYSRRSVQMFDLWTAVYGGNGRFVRVMGSQAGNSSVANMILNFENAKAKTDALAIAPYFSMVVGPDSWGGTLTESNVQGWTVTQALDYLQNTALPEASGWMRANKQVANAAGVPRLICYEAGQHAVGAAGVENNTAITNLLMAANRNPRMSQLYQTYLDNWKTESGNDLICLFASVGGFSKWGSWGMQEYLDQGPDVSPKLAGVLAWRAAHPDNNLAPVLALGGNRTAAIGASITLTPTITDDALSKMPVLVSWTSSSTAVTFGNPASANTTLSATAAGAYALTLTANDGLTSSQASITLTVSGAGSSPTLVVSTNAVTVNEGSTSTFTVQLSAAPAGTTTVTVARTAGDTDLSVSGGANLTFTTVNWNTAQTVTLAAAEDADTANGSATITVAAAGLTSQTVTATEADNDTITQGLTVSATTATVAEGGTTTFTVRLNVAPAGTTTVTVARTEGDADISVSGGANLTFTTANWNTPQTVTLAAAEDVDTANGSATITVAAVGLTSKTVIATEADKDIPTSTPKASEDGNACGAGSALGLILSGFLALRLQQRGPIKEDTVRRQKPA